MVREHACLHYRHYIRVVMFVCVYLYVYFIISVSVSRCAYVFVYTHQCERPVCLLYLYTSYISVKDLSVSMLLIHLIYQFVRLTDKNKCINHINLYRILPVKTNEKEKTFTSLVTFIFQRKQVHTNISYCTHVDYLSPRSIWLHRQLKSHFGMRVTSLARAGQ